MQTVQRYGNLQLTACALVEALKDGTPGDVLTDEELAEVAGDDTSPGGEAYAALMSAIRYVAKHFGRVWKRTPKAGAIKCLNAGEVVGVGRSAVGSIRRKARRTAHSLSQIDYGSLTPDGQREARAVGAQLGTIALFSETGTTKKLEARAAQSVPDVGRLLESWK